MNESPVPFDARRIGIDNFRFFYLTLDETYELPGVTTTGITPAEKEELFATLRRLQPEFCAGLHVLEQNRPARYATELHLARALNWESSRFVLVLRILAEYRGGAERSEIVSGAGGERTPRIRTNKIYYRARIVPCAEIRQDGERVLDFTPLRLPDVESVYTEVKEDGSSPGRAHTFAIFNDPDFQEFNAGLVARLGDWPHPGVYFPFVADDFVTVSLNLIYPHSYYTEVLLPYFARFFEAVVAGQEPSPADRMFWNQYFAGMELERSYSRSGNPHWRFRRLPWS